MKIASTVRGMITLAPEETRRINIPSPVNPERCFFSFTFTLHGRFRRLLRRLFRRPDTTLIDGILDIKSGEWIEFRHIEGPGPGHVDWVLYEFDQKYGEWHEVS